jgi:GT2 family glycosyltransferase
MTAPAISVVIPTYNRHQHVLDTVRVLRAEAALVGGEVIVVDQSDDGSADATRDALAGMPEVRYLRHSPPSLPEARNIGIERSRGAVVLFVDDDVVPTERLLRAHLAAHAEPGVGCVAGRVVEAIAGRNRNTDRAGTRVDWLGRVYRHYDHPLPADVDAPPGGNMSFSRAALDRVGGFDREYLGNAALEETDFGFRVAAAGFRIRYVPDAELLHLAAPAGGCRVIEPLARERSNFRNLSRFYRKHKPVALFPLFVVANAAVFLKRTWGVRSLPSLVLTYLGAVRDGFRSLRGEPA